MTKVSLTLMDDIIPQDTTNSATRPPATFVADQNLRVEDEGGAGKNLVSEAIKLDFEMEKRNMTQNIVASESLETELKMELMTEKQIMGSSDDDLGEKLKMISHPVDQVDDLDQINQDPQKNNMFEKVLGQGLPSSGISGMKRKAETSAEEEKAFVSKDSQNKKWHCSLCEVSTASAGGYNLHIHGKKHRAKETMFKSSETVNMISINNYSTNKCLLPREEKKSQVLLVEEEKSRVLPAEEEKGQVQPTEEGKSRVQPAEEEKSQVQPAKEEKCQVQPIEEEESRVQPVKEEKSRVQPVEDDKTLEREKSPVTKKWECSLCPVSVTSEILLISHLQGKKHKAKAAKLGIVLVNNETEVESEDTKKWYCSVCQVSASSENNLNDHLQGKKHKAKAGLLHQEADNGDCNSGEDAKAMEERCLEGDEGFRNEQEVVNKLNIAEAGIKGDIANSEENEIETISTESIEIDKLGNGGEETGKELVKFWHCKICNEETYDEAAMDTHRKSNKHMDLLRKIGGGLVVVSNVLKEAAPRMQY
ncbi:UBP1-associated proteins 1C-like isoform X2 [Amaranthus tricolor]|uniref:UBP1-associated proteins 1C-like isoform X2 n=1 Tax=Amaranthus tricolor TaxID=29722 RepID=UPI002583C0F9|nr:UBP1-associated proteins 1C-like isoform X2 [Amaranthus tricolor]